MRRNDAPEFSHQTPYEGLQGKFASQQDDLMPHLRVTNEHDACETDDSCLSTTSRGCLAFGSGILSCLSASKFFLVCCVSPGSYARGINKESKCKGLVSVRSLFAIGAILLLSLGAIAAGVASAIHSENEKIVDFSVDFTCPLNEKCSFNHTFEVDTPLPLYVYLSQKRLFFNNREVVSSLNKKLMKVNAGGKVDCKNSSCGRIVDHYPSDVLFMSKRDQKAFGWDESRVSLRPTREFPSRLLHVGNAGAIGTPKKLEHLKSLIEPPLMPGFRRLYAVLRGPSIHHPTDSQSLTISPEPKKMSFLANETIHLNVISTAKHFNPDGTKSLYFTTMGRFGGKHIAIMYLLSFFAGFMIFVGVALVIFGLALKTVDVRETAEFYAEARRERRELVSPVQQNGMEMVPLKMKHHASLSTLADSGRWSMDTSPNPSRDGTPVRSVPGRSNMLVFY